MPQVALNGNSIKNGCINLAVLGHRIRSVRGINGDFWQDRRGVASSFATLIRTTVVLALLAGIAIGTKATQPLAGISSKTYVFLALSGIATGLSWLCYYQALKMGPASGAAPIDKLSALIVAVFGVSLLGEKLSPLGWLGVAIIAGGALLVGMQAKSA